MEISRLKLIEYQKELKSLNERLPDIIRRKQAACAEGDLRENTEYDTASTEHNSVKIRIMQLETLINDSKIIEPDLGQYINLGSFVRVKPLGLEDEEEELVLRVDSEGDMLAEEPYNRVLSVKSPLGAAILNSVSGEYTIQAPMGELRYAVTKIPFDEIKAMYDLNI